jgi:2Fe-2S ferredoxin
LTRITVIDREGVRHELDASNGTSVMEVATNNGVPGIYAECGGTCSCATCHVYVDEAWRAATGVPDDLEDGMLDAAIDRRPNSRLCCQITITPELDGLVVEVADNNL